MKTENINGFIWAVLDKEQAEELFTDGYDVQEYSDNAGFFLVLDVTDISLAIMAGRRVLLEIGAEKELKADYLEATERNNENRTFEDWCLSKIE